MADGGGRKRGIRKADPGVVARRLHGAR